MNLTEFAIKNKVLTYFVVALIVVGGVASFLQLGQLDLGRTGTWIGGDNDGFFDGEILRDLK